MGKKTKNPASGPGGRAGKYKFWCYYCGADSKDEGTLIQHQAAKHFACPFCDVGAFGRLCQSLSGLVSHVRRSHRKELDKVPGAMPGRESTETDVYAMNGIPANVLEAANQNNPVDNDEDDAPAPSRNNAQAPAPQSFSNPVSSGGDSEGQGMDKMDNITQALAGAASDSTSPMAKALLAAVATNSPATAGDTDNIIKAVLRAATAPKDQRNAGGFPQMQMPSGAPPSGGSYTQPEGMRPAVASFGLAKASAMTGQMGGLLGAAKDQRSGGGFPQMSMLSDTSPSGGSIAPSEGMMGAGGLLGGSIARASAMTGQMGGLLGAAKETDTQSQQLALSIPKPANPAPSSNSWGTGSGYSSLGLPQPPRSGSEYTLARSFPDPLPLSLGMGGGMPSSGGMGGGPRTSNKEEKPPPFPTRAEFRKALQEEERKAELMRFRPGNMVELKGLVNCPKLNGLDASVVSVMPDGHIMTVKVLLTDSGKHYCVRPQNMMLQRGDTGQKMKRARSSSSSTSSTKRKKRQKKADAATKKAKKLESAAQKTKQPVASGAIDLT